MSKCQNPVKVFRFWNAFEVVVGTAMFFLTFAALFNGLTFQAILAGSASACGAFVFALIDARRAGFKDGLIGALRYAVAVLMFFAFSLMDLFAQGEPRPFLG